MLILDSPSAGLGFRGPEYVRPPTDMVFQRVVGSWMGLMVATEVEPFSRLDGLFPSRIL